MKNFFSKNWKKIVYVLCGIAILINLILVFITPATIVDEYYKYGPSQYADVGGQVNVGNISGDVNDGVDNLTDYVQDKTGYSDSSARVLVISALLVCGVLILSNIIDDSSSSSEKKKK